MMQIEDFDYEFLKGEWKGVKGAAYNQVYEYLLENGFINRDGIPTSKGYQAIQVYEMEKWNI